ncbi:MAG: methyltransferase domain-containing protein [Chloroflexota bacterium]|nr:methyltransferase domain-containing protein [Chloroflexota bacterium]MDE2918858.1 methyltransferase domain-containing protein [Chloroflexota bacterium]
MDRAEVDSYDQIVESYDSLVREVTLGRLLSRLARRLLCLAGDVSGLKVLDAGCGEGHLALLFARNGADVLGVDIAPRRWGNAAMDTPALAQTALVRQVLDTPRDA